ncbi:MAG: rhomboid family intramembrane serine protease [Candidatus Bathyarchaeia archaeon]
MIPIRDANRSLTTPHLTRIFLIINVTVFLVSWLSEPLGLYDSSPFESTIWRFGMIPSDLINGHPRALYTLFTSMFLHGGPVHLIGNMLYLYIFGDNVEDAFGHKRYFLFYLISGIVASLAHVGTLLTSAASLDVPTIGASGAISGVLGAYLVLYPRARVLTLLLLGWIYIVPIPAVLLLGFWFIFQLLYGMLELEIGVASGIAYWAHIGGFMAGLLFGLAWRSRRSKREL